MGRLYGKTALVIAAVVGIRCVTAEAFAREGFRVVANDVDAGKLDGLAGDRLADILERDGEIAALAMGAIHINDGGYSL